MRIANRPTRVQRRVTLNAPSRKREGGEDHTPPRHLIPRPPAQHIGQRTLPRPVRPHNRMDLARIDAEREPLEDRLVRDRGGEVIDLEHFQFNLHTDFMIFSPIVSGTTALAVE